MTSESKYDLPCVDCLKLPLCRTKVVAKFVASVNSRYYEKKQYDAINFTIRSLVVNCVDIYEFLYNKTTSIENADTKQMELLNTLNKCRVDVVRDYYFNY